MSYCGKEQNDDFALRGLFLITEDYLAAGNIGFRVYRLCGKEKWQKKKKKKYNILGYGRGQTRLTK